MQERQSELFAVLPSGIEGRGLFALYEVTCGSVLLRIDDSRVVNVDRPLRPDDGESSTHRDFLPDGTVVLMQSPEKYVNHSCNPNCYIYSTRRERYLLAKRHITAGEELLIDYAVNAIGGEHWNCHCGAVQCRSGHRCDFFALPAQVQLEYLPYLDPWFATVHAQQIQKLLGDSKP